MIKNLSNVKTKYNKSNGKLKIAIVRSNYHQNLTKSLEKVCYDELIAAGVKKNNITTFTVPGSWEIPLFVKNIALKKKFAGIITFGVIIKGETYHFEMIASECSRALMDISLQFNIPIIFEILATYNLKQAEQRCTGKFNKGIEAAQTVLETIKQLKNL